VYGIITAFVARLYAQCFELFHEYGLPILIGELTQQDWLQLFKVFEPQFQVRHWKSEGVSHLDDKWKQ